jgi:DNA-binding MarR family transcriptional regulator
VANLEAAGLVHRSADPDDRRAARVTLTAAGRSRLTRLRTERNAYLQQRLAALTARDRETLAAALAVLTTLAETGR